MYYTVTKHSSHLRTLEKCRKQSPGLRLVFSTFPSCLAQMPAVFYHSVIHSLGFFICYIYIFITHNTRILFHKAHLYKSIRFIFTYEKSLYSQSELRTAHVEV